ncbi:MAG: putative manganese transporter [Eubacteriales bacterium]
MDIFELILDTLLDTVKLLPFLFLTYLLMEYLEHRAGNSAQKVLKRSGQFGAVIGSAIGVVPQCGFSSAAASLYSAGVISLGTLMAVFLSTSDEMVPIFISRGGNLGVMLKILAVKFVIALVIGLAIDLVLKLIYKKKGIEPKANIEALCERDRCHCHNNMLKSALVHTGKISLFILIFSFILNFIVVFIGEKNIALLVLDKPVIANVLAGVVGLIPNCASSVIISELFINGVISSGALLSGLLANTGIATAVLFRTNRPKKQSLLIIALLFVISVIVGIVIDLTPLARWLAI